MLTLPKRERFLLALSHRAPRWVCRCRTAVLLSRDLTEGVTRTTSSAPPLENIVFRPLEYHEAEESLDLMHITSMELHRRFENGDRCYAALCGSHIAHVQWVHTGACYICALRAVLLLKQTECYVYQVHTHADYQGRGIYKWARQELDRCLADIGIRRTASLVRTYNAVPLHVLSKFGYRSFGTVSCATTCGYTFAWTRLDSDSPVACRIQSDPAGFYWI